VPQPFEAPRQSRRSQSRSPGEHRRVYLTELAKRLKNGRFVARQSERRAPLTDAHER
jgi:hypothetical protein